MAAAIARLRDPDTGLQKVVLARALELTAETLEPNVGAAPTGHRRSVGVCVPGRPEPGRPGVRRRCPLGASPNCWSTATAIASGVRRSPSSAPCSADPDVDAANGAALVASGRTAMSTSW